jgi:hypothetical protein
MGEEHNRRKTDQGTAETESVRDYFAAMAPVHRDLGRLEGRIGALEQTMTDVKQWMISISNKLSAIQTSVDSSSGTAVGEKTTTDRLWTILAWLASTAVAIATIWVMIHYGR